MRRPPAAAAAVRRPWMRSRQWTRFRIGSGRVAPDAAAARSQVPAAPIARRGGGERRSRPRCQCRCRSCKPSRGNVLFSMQWERLRPGCYKIRGGRSPTTSSRLRNDELVCLIISKRSKSFFTPIFALLSLN